MAFSMFSTPQPQQPQPFFQPQQQQQQQQQQQSFQSSPLFSQPQQQQFPQQQLFQPQQQQQQQQQRQQQQQLFLFTNDKAPASYGTKWVDLHPDSQKMLLQIEERILEYRDESQRLDQCSRLYDSSVSNEAFELDASHIMQEIGGISTSMERQKAQLQELMAVAKDMLRNTEIAVRSFMMLRSRFHPIGGGGSVATAPSHAPGVSSAPGAAGQPTSSSIVPVFDFYRGLPKKPSPFLQQTVARFEKYLAECRQWIEELEQLLLLDSDRISSDNRLSLLESLPKVISNVHSFFVHVAAKVESIHQYVETMKTAYLADQRRRGDSNDPFLEAERRETAKLEAAAKRVHPTLHLPTNSQPSTQGAGLLTNSATPGTSVAPQTSTATPATSGIGASLLTVPSATPSSSIHVIPFSGMPFAAPTSGPPGASTPSLFSGSAPSYGHTASAGGSLFSKPSASGAAMGSGSSFGTATKPQRPKTRSTRR